MPLYLWDGRESTNGWLIRLYSSRR